MILSSPAFPTTGPLTQPTLTFVVPLFDLILLHLSCRLLHRPWLTTCRPPAEATTTPAFFIPPPSITSKRATRDKTSPSLDLSVRPIHDGHRRRLPSCAHTHARACISARARCAIPSQGAEREKSIITTTTTTRRKTNVCSCLRPSSSPVSAPSATDGRKDRRPQTTCKVCARCVTIPEGANLTSLPPYTYTSSIQKRIYKKTSLPLSETCNRIDQSAGATPRDHCRRRIRHSPSPFLSLSFISISQ